MSNTSETPINYRGFVIAKSPRVEYGNFVFYMEPFDGYFQDADSIEHARQQIDERIELQEIKRPVPMTVTGDELDLRVLFKSVHKMALMMNLSNEPDAKEFIILSRWSLIINQALKDLKIDANTLPFPEK